MVITVVSVLLALLLIWPIHIFIKNLPDLIRTTVEAWSLACWDRKASELRVQPWISCYAHAWWSRWDNQWQTYKYENGSYWYSTSNHWVAPKQDKGNLS